MEVCTVTFTARCGNWLHFMTACLLKTSLNKKKSNKNLRELLNFTCKRLPSVFQSFKGHNLQLKPHLFFKDGALKKIILSTERKSIIIIGARVQ